MTEWSSWSGCNRHSVPNEMRAYSMFPVLLTFGLLFRAVGKIKLDLYILTRFTMLNTSACAISISISWLSISITVLQLLLQYLVSSGMSEDS